MNRSKNSNRIISSSDDESCSDSDCVETDGNPVANSIASCSRPRRRKKKIQRLGTVSETYDDLVNTLERQKSYENDNSNDHSVSEPILKRLFDDMQAKIITKFEESFRVIEKKVDDAIVQITRVEFKIGARRSVSESMTVRKRSRLLSITRETPLSDIKSLGFPLKSTADVEKFENDLKQEEYRQNVLEALMNINGNGGEMNAGKLIRLTFKEMFTEATLGCYTYTGKNKNTKRFDVFANIREIVYDLLKAADRTYTLVEYERDLVEKIFKYAYKGREKSSTTSSSSTSICTYINSSSDASGVVLSSRRNIISLLDENTQQLGGIAQVSSNDDHRGYNNNLIDYRPYYPYARHSYDEAYDQDCHDIQADYRNNELSRNSEFSPNNLQLVYPPTENKSPHHV